MSPERRQQALFAANILGFQIGWFACVLGGASRHPWLGTAVAFGLLALHLWHAPRARLEARLLLAAAAIGILFDTALVRLGLATFPSGAVIAGTAPVWMTCMWMLFAATLNVSLAWLKSRLPLAGVLGLIGGPMAYLAGERLGGIALARPLSTTVLVLAAGWAVLTPLLVWLARRLDGFIAPLEIDR